jgi:hypothetical protein
MTTALIENFNALHRAIMDNLFKAYERGEGARYVHDGNTSRYCLAGMDLTVTYEGDRQVTYASSRWEVTLLKKKGVFGGSSTPMFGEIITVSGDETEIITDLAAFVLALS